MPGATTASEEFFEAAIDWKLDMMPQTVPNRPTNGPAHPRPGDDPTNDRLPPPVRLQEQRKQRHGGSRHRQDRHICGIHRRYPLNGVLLLSMIRSKNRYRLFRIMLCPKLSGSKRLP